MPDYLAQGNKTVRCKCGHKFSIPYQTTVCKCPSPSCGCITLFRFFGVVTDKYDNYVY